MRFEPVIDFRDPTDEQAPVCEFKKFLTDDFLVPEDQMTLLLNKDATRDKIIKAFQDIANDKRIQKYDPIVIYYAGRGSLVDSPPDHTWNRSRVQCIIPQDTSKATGIVAIPDFTIGALLTLIDDAKGSNIVMIADCCHSSGGLHDHQGSRFIAKSQIPELLSDLDAEIIAPFVQRTRALIGPESLLTQNMTSLALLAPCSHGEVAFENSVEGYGYLTRALLKLLRSIKVDTLTYKECTQCLPSLRTRQPQTPVCEGKNVNHRFFECMVLDPKSRYIAVKAEGTSNALFLQAGLAQGVTPGCTFAIHGDRVNGPNNPALGTLVAAECGTFCSSLTPLSGAASFVVPNTAYGYQTGYGEDQALNVHITEGFVNAAKPDPQWGRVFSGGQANGQATFTTLNPSAIAHGIQELPFTIDPTADAVSPVLHAAARWSHHLRRMPGARPFHKSVQMEFYKLDWGTQYDARGNPILEPIGENLNQGGEAALVLGDRTKSDPYGFKITNSSSHDLYAYPFYFGVPGQDITRCFSRRIGTAMTDPPLLRNAPLTLGYGSEGGRPLMFRLYTGCDLDVGIFKMFLTTEPADFHSIQQLSPFEGARASTEDHELEDHLARQPLWDVVTMTLVQRRNPKPAE